jgi:hypothetical protein
MDLDHLQGQAEAPYSHHFRTRGCFLAYFRQLHGCTLDLEKLHGALDTLANHRENCSFRSSVAV